MVMVCHHGAIRRRSGNGGAAVGSRETSQRMMGDATTYLLRGAAGDYFDQPLSGRPSTSQSSENSALVVVIIARREGSSARPTMLLPLSTISASAFGVMRTMPRLPASEPATYKFPARSNANPCGRPRPRKNVLTSPAGLMRYTRSKLEVVGPVTYNSSAGLNAR